MVDIATLVGIDLIIRIPLICSSLLLCEASCYGICYRLMKLDSELIFMMFGET